MSLILIALLYVVTAFLAYTAFEVYYRYKGTWHTFDIVSVFLSMVWPVMPFIGLGLLVAWAIVNIVTGFCRLRETLIVNIVDMIKQKG